VNAAAPDLHHAVDGMMAGEGAAPPRRMLRAAAWSLAFAAALVALYGLAVATPWGQAVDARSLGVPYLLTPVFSALRVGMPIVAAVGAAAALVAGLVRRRWADVIVSALAAGAVIAASGWLRDDVFARPDLGLHGYLANTFPSRHVVITCALAAVVVRLWPWPERRRGVVVGAAAVTTAAAYASMATYAHRASDTLGGVLLVGVVAAVFARGRVPGIRAAALRHPPAAWVTCASCVLGAGLGCVPVTVVSAIGFTLLVLTGTASLTTVVMRVVAA
jgi:hypothetical protein